MRPRNVKAPIAAKPITIVHPALLIRINQLYRPGMSAQELYEATRGTWVLGERRNRVTLALPVFNGVVQEVYVVDDWHPAGTTPYAYRLVRDIAVPGRWEFTGRPAPAETRSKYLYGSVHAYFRHGQQNPIAYVNA